MRLHVKHIHYVISCCPGNNVETMWKFYMDILYCTLATLYSKHECFSPESFQLFCSSLNNIVIAFISSRRHLRICYILCSSDSISYSHIGYIPCGCKCCIIRDVGIILTHFKVFKCSILRSSGFQFCVFKDVWCVSDRKNGKWTYLYQVCMTPLKFLIGQ